MCVIVYKPKGQDLPSINRLYDCFVANPDGAGYMFQEKGGVHIKKGFMTFSDFYAHLKEDYDDNSGKDVDFVMHFRISTQGGVNQKCCHPYSISKNMEDLYLLDTKTPVGVAHNGIIHLTSESEYTYGYSTYTDKDGNTYGYVPKQYNDTMKFITDYMSLFIKDGLDVYDDDKMELLERLIGSSNKLAIMTTLDTKLVGYFTEWDGCFYSNTYFLYASTKKSSYEAKNTAKTDYDSYDETLLDDYYESDDEGLVDGALYGSCGMAETCRHCKWFSGCFGIDFPEDWEQLSDDDLQEILDAYYGGYDDDKIQELVDKFLPKGGTKDDKSKTNKM